MKVKSLSERVLAATAATIVAMTGAVVPLSAQEAEDTEVTPAITNDALDDAPVDDDFLGPILDLARQTAANPEFELNDVAGGVEITGLGDATLTDGKLTIPAEIDGKKVIGIADRAFQDKSIKELTFADDSELEYIGEGAFQGNQIKEVELPGVKVGKDAFRDNVIEKVTFDPAPGTEVELDERAFINNRISGTIDLTKVSKVGAEAFAANKITEAKVGAETEFVARELRAPTDWSEGDYLKDVFSRNGSWVVVRTDEGVTPHESVSAETYRTTNGGYGHVVNPVVVTVRYEDENGKRIAPDLVLGEDYNDLYRLMPVFERGKEAEHTPRTFPNYTLLSDSPVRFTPTGEEFVLTVKYKEEDNRPKLTFPEGGIAVPENAANLEEELLKGVAATDARGKDITSRIKVDSSAVDVKQSGSYEAIYTVTDERGQQVTERVPVQVTPDGTANWEDYEVDGWQVKDFTYDGNGAVTGLSESGQKKLDGGKTDLSIPPVDTNGHPVTSIGEGAFRGKAFTEVKDWGKVKKIEQAAFEESKVAILPDTWGEITEIGESAFNDADLREVPTDWGKVEKLGDNAFLNQKISRLPDSWGNVSELGRSVFRNTDVRKLPDSWGKITEIPNGAFEKTPITGIPEDWGGVTRVGNSAFLDTKITQLPDSWGDVESLGTAAFKRTPIEELPESWGKITRIEESAFDTTKIVELPENWGDVDFIANAAFANNYSLTTIPDSWGKITSIGRDAFARSKITEVPDDWGEVREIEDYAFVSTGISELPTTWGKMDKIGQGAFERTQVKDLPKDWADVSSIGENSFRNQNLPPGMVFEMPSEKITQQFLDDLAKSGLKKPIHIRTTDGKTPSGLNIPSGILINPVALTIKHQELNKTTNVLGPLIGPESVTVYVSGNSYYEYVPPVIKGYEVLPPQRLWVGPEAEQEKYVHYDKEPTPTPQRSNIELELERYEQRIGQDMTGKIKIDRSGFDAEDLKNPRVQLTFDPSVYDIESFRMTAEELGIDPSTIKRQGSTFSFEIPDLAPGTTLEIPFQTRFIPGQTPEKTPHPIIANLIDENGVSVAASEPKSFTGYYKHPYERVTTKNERADGGYTHYDREIVKTQTGREEGYVAADEPGKDVKNTLTHQINVYDIERNIADYQIRVPLPSYPVHKSAPNYDETKPHQLATFDPAKNPGWTLTDDGTAVVYQGNNGDSMSTITQNLTLGYPGAVEDYRIPIEATTIMTPSRMTENESLFVVTDSHKNFFLPDRKLPDGEIFNKFSVGNHNDYYLIIRDDVEIEEYRTHFFDNALERDGEFPWTVVYNAPETLNNFVIRDLDLDERMYHDSIVVPRNLGDVTIRVLDSRGAELETIELKRRDDRKVTFDKNRVLKAKEVRIELKNPLEKGTFGEVLFTSRLKDPSKPILEKNEGSDHVFKNSATVEFDGQTEEAIATAEKTARKAEQEIAAFKTQQGFRSDGQSTDKLITGDSLLYTVGFNPRVGFGETISEIEVIDLLPTDIDIESVSMSEEFQRLPGARYEIVGNYNETGQTAIIFRASTAHPWHVTPGRNFNAGAIRVKTNLAIPDKRIDNEVFVKAQNTELANKVTDDRIGDGEWSKADVWTNYTAAAAMEQRKQVRTYDKDDKPGPWTSSAVVRPGQKLDYRLRLFNGTNNPREGIVAYDVLPHRGDKGIPAPRGSEFTNTIDRDREPTLPEGYSIAYYNGNDWPEYDGNDRAKTEEVLKNLEWSPKPAWNTKAIRITQDPGVTLAGRERVEIVLPMNASREGADRQGNPPTHLIGKEANNTFFYRDKTQTTLIEGNKASTEMQRKPMSIAFQKTNNKNEPLPGAVFELRSSGGGVVATAVSDDQGKVRFDNVDVRPGSVVVETKAPAGYAVNKTPRTITEDMITTGYRQVGSVIRMGSWENLPEMPPAQYGEVEFTKIDVDGKPLPGTRFQLKGRPERAQEDHTYYATANAEGRVIFANVLPGNSYTLTETRPVGALQPIDPIAGIPVRPNATTKLGKTVNGQENAIVNDKVQIPLVKLGVTTDRLKDESGQDRAFGTFTAADGVRLVGSTFEVKEKESGNVVATVEPGTDTYAPTIIKNLKAGKTYVLVETKTPEGYEPVPGLNTEFKVDTRGRIVDANGKAMPVQNGLFVPNHRKTEPSTVTITKHDQDGNNLAGATFELQRLDEKEDGTEEWVRVGEPVTTGADGIAAFDGFTDGKFRVVETAAPAGYIGSFVSPEFIAQRTVGRTFTYTAENAKIKPRVAKVELLNTGSKTEKEAEWLLKNIFNGYDGARIEYRNGGWDVVAGLEGAKFNLYEGDVNGTLIQQLETGEDGYAYITETIDPKKDYVLVETEAPKGYVKRERPVTFNAAAALADTRGTEPGVFTVLAPNTPDTSKPGRIVVSKLDAGTGKPLTSRGQSAVFTLQRVEKLAPGVDKCDSKILELDGERYCPGEETEQGTSESSGIAVFDNLEYGTYVVRENWAPVGYALDPTPTIYEVNEETPTHTRIFENKPEDPKIQVKKYINGWDANNWLTAATIPAQRDKMDVKFEITNTGNVALSSVKLTDVIRGVDKESEGQYLDRMLRPEDYGIANELGIAVENPTLTVKSKDGRTITQQKNGEVELEPGATAEITLEGVKAPDVNSTHVDDATVEGTWYERPYWEEKKVTSTDPAHAYRLPVPLPLPSTGDAPWLIRMLIFGGLSLLLGMYFANRSVRHKD